jgi:hypothetical protein
MNVFTEHLENAQPRATASFEALAARSPDNNHSFCELAKQSLGAR